MMCDWSIGAGDEDCSGEHRSSDVNARPGMVDGRSSNGPTSSFSSPPRMNRRTAASGCGMLRRRKLLSRIEGGEIVESVRWITRRKLRTGRSQSVLHSSSDSPRTVHGRYDDADQLECSGGGGSLDAEPLPMLFCSADRKWCTPRDRMRCACVPLTYPSRCRRLGGNDVRTAVDALLSSQRSICRRSSKKCLTGLCVDYVRNSSRFSASASGCSSWWTTPTTAAALVVLLLVSSVQCTPRRFQGSVLPPRGPQQRGTDQVPSGGGGGSPASRGPRSDDVGAGVGADGAGVPCIYEGHIKTDRDWYGYIANVTVRTTGQLGFEFVYPADRCCQNVLFYLDEQAAIIGPRMNCWQREYLLRPEDDQILRLTPSFSWSGCHVVGSEMGDVGDLFVCKGGRSFSVYADRLTTWHIAVSNCATLTGLDLQYRLEVYGHVGDCAGRRADPPTSFISESNGNNNNNNPSGSIPAGSRGASLTPREAATHPRSSKAAEEDANDDERVCVVSGDINSTYSWYGFVRNMSLEAGGGYRFMFTYPYSMQVQNIVLYNEEDVRQLDWEQSCWQKEAVISVESVLDQILDMSYRSTWSGCSFNQTTVIGAGSLVDGSMSAVSSGSSAASDLAALQATVVQQSAAPGNLTCQGERRYEKPRKVFMALSNCRSNGAGLRLRYRLEVFGYASDDPCARNGATALSTSSRQQSVGPLAAAWSRHRWSALLAASLVIELLMAQLIDCDGLTTFDRFCGHGDRSSVVRLT